MAADVHSKGVTWDTPNGSLAPVGYLPNSRSESPTPGLVEGTEPGASQERAMFVHTQSFEDLTADVELTGSQTEEVEEREEEQQRGEGKGDGAGGGGEGEVEEEPKQEVQAVVREKEEDVTSETWRLHKKHVFVLSEAGKPIYTRYGSEEALSTTMGVLMALVSFVEAAKNVILSIHADGFRVVFLRKSPLVLVCVSRTGQSDGELWRELHYVYYQILSLLTLPQLQRVFQQRQSFDLRRLLAGSERVTAGLLRLLETDAGLMLNATMSLPLCSTTRNIVCTSLQAASSKNLVFSVLLAGNRLVALIRKKEQHLHHTDLHLLSNLAASSSSFRQGEAWTPVCLPKFNASGFFHAHISYLEPASDLCLILVSTDREDFFNLSDCKQRFLERLKKRNAYQTLQEALISPTYPASQVGIPELWHFVYKSKSSGLYTSPEMTVPYHTEEEQERLMEMYRYLHSRLHHPTRPLRSIYRCTHTENLLAWSTSGFELYLCFSPLATKSLAVSAVTKLLKWIRKEEDRLFILNSLTY
ncbi:vacuolar fusion protein MON1 homolog A isoform X1 [Tachysurus fulvidraco]|uniref:vacuolar fusion protein MON1 homolog A isoform X1 n=2 Tax=Tachysurus fulvidraco TaxID=1234273 RepID=UPI000F4EE702|nr:vacuolar fusion protein MON1 homolog A isoform X1 [Tachysurus fulvidraco]XP_027009593.1 vacuolar fusion protein MON1 homolog A isoform X1 [Tachysurus fulvidraco]XP_027009594.1 vacuolar fusion protein MON1 homolog A isoform X1 [Tachysurus fulvidraco]